MNLTFYFRHAPTSHQWPGSTRAQPQGKLVRGIKGWKNGCRKRADERAIRADNERRGRRKGMRKWKRIDSQLTCG